MDKIFSRKRLSINRLHDIKRDKKSIRKIAIIIILGLLTALLIIHEFNPVFNKLCRQKASAISTEVINLESSKVFDKIDYEDLVNVIKDDNR